MDITALAGTANVRLTCSIQLINDIGPDDSALSVSWSIPVPTVAGTMSPTPMTQKEFNSTLNIPLIMKGQYCCNHGVKYFECRYEYFTSVSSSNGYYSTRWNS